MSVAAAAYSASKSALASLAESLNDQEGRSGIRTTLLIPGEVDTEIASTRPVPPTPEERRAMLDPDDIGRVVQSIVDLPDHVCVNEVVVSVHPGTP
jgi:NADP-dependent 3-hydroxy acid dehydrogenase YdfG